MSDIVLNSWQGTDYFLFQMKYRSMEMKKQQNSLTLTAVLRSPNRP
jgi:hypothetical protein